MGLHAMIATRVHEDHIAWVGRTDIFAVDPPFHGHDHVAVSIHQPEYGQWHNAGTEIIGCLPDGGIDGDVVLALYRTYEVLTFPDALQRIGYTLAE